MLAELGLTGMAELQVKIGTLHDFKRRTVAALKAAQEGRLRPTPHSISFPTYEAMRETLAPPRLEIVNALVGQGPLTIQEVARLVGRDIEAVRHDVTRLINSGVIERDADGVRFDYDGLRWP